MTFILFALLCQQLAPEQAIEQRQYLSAAREYQKTAHELKDTKIFRKYVVLLTESYTSQVGWRTFFSKDLREGERLSELRVDTRTLTAGSIGEMLERNLEALLMTAQKRYPKDLNVRFAVANYVFRGQCCQASPKLKMTPREALAIFEEAYKAGIYSGGSMLALALYAERLNDNAKSLVYYKKGLELAGEDIDLSFGYANALLREKEYGKAIDQSRKVFELALAAEMKVGSLLVAARALYGLEQYEEAAKTCEKVLELSPGHGFAFHIRLDALRRVGDQERYTTAIDAFLALRKEDPSPFQSYMNYLRVREPDRMDFYYMGHYRKSQAETPMEAVVKLVNLGSFASFEKKPEKALELFKKARKQAKAMDDAPQDVIAFLDKLIASKPKK